MDNLPFSQSLPGLPKPFDMIFVEGGEFLMGSPNNESEAFYTEKPQHTVLIPNFYMGKFQVTQALWNTVIDSVKPSRFEVEEDRPVNMVSLDDITQVFLPQLQRLTGLSYRIPTESEWEYAARGGKFHSEGYKYSGSDRLKDVGWFDGNSSRKIKSVGLKYPNQLGIYDMSGNLWEWCEDDWHDSYHDAPKNGDSWMNSIRGSIRVLRGGSYNREAGYCRVTSRYSAPSGAKDYDIGLRLALSV